LACSRLSVTSLETEEILILVGQNDAGQSLDDTQCRRLFDLPAVQANATAVPASVERALNEDAAKRQRELLEALIAKNGHWFDAEMDKLDRWADDRRAALKAELEEFDQEIKEVKKAARMAPNLPDKLELQRKLRMLETKRDDSWRAYDAASRDIDRQKDSLLDEISRRLDQKTECDRLFAIRWSIK
jgi:hypothetical protein